MNKRNYKILKLDIYRWGRQEMTLQKQKVNKGKLDLACPHKEIDF